MSSYTENIQFGETLLSKLWKKVSGQTSNVASTTSRPQTMVTEAIVPPVVPVKKSFPWLLLIATAGAGYIIYKKKLLKKVGIV